MIPNAQLTTTQWLSLPIEIRNRLKELFDIPRSEGSHVLDNEVVSDGYTHADLAFISVERMQALLDSDDNDFFSLFDQVLRSLEASQTPPVEVMTPEPAPVAPIKNKGGRPKKTK